MQRRFRAASRGLCLSVIALAACGGAQEEPTPSESGRTEVAQQAAALDQYRRDQPFLAARAKIASGALEAPGVPTARSCAQTLHAKLSRGASGSEEPFDCLVGLYRGVDLHGRECALRIEPTPQGYRFQRQPGGVFVVAAEPTARLQSVTLAHKLAASDGENGLIALRLSREDRSPGGAVENLVLTLASPRGDGRDQPEAMSFERAQDGSVQILRCRFSAG